jgi:predicted RNase H-like HicB family nuclease
MKKTITASSFLTYFNRNGSPRGDVISFCHEHYLVSQGRDQHESLACLVDMIRDYVESKYDLPEPTPPEELQSAIDEYAYIDKREIEVEFEPLASYPATSMPS